MDVAPLGVSGGFEEESKVWHPIPRKHERVKISRHLAKRAATHELGHGLGMDASFKGTDFEVARLGAGRLSNFSLSLLEGLISTTLVDDPGDATGYRS